MFPDRTFEIIFHRENARTQFFNKDFNSARLSYFKWIESVKQQNINTSGQLDEEFKLAEEEYSEFVKSDPLYLKICESVLPIIKEIPGILQTELYKAFPDINKNDISYSLYFATKHGILTRTKNGRTYEVLINSNQN